MKETKIGPYKIRSYIDAEAFAQDVQIVGVALNDAFIEQPSLFASYSLFASKARAQFDIMKSNVSAVMAMVDSEIRAEAQARKEKITEKAIEANVLSHQKVIEAKKAEAMARMVMNDCECAVDAMKQRKDSLISIGANYREEIDGTLVIKGTESTTDKVQRLNEMMKKSMG